MYRIAVLASGGGSNFESVQQAVLSGEIPNAQIACLISDQTQAGALKKAERFGIPSFILPKREYRENLSDAILEVVEGVGEIDLVVLAGFLSILEGEILKRYKDRIINIHPSLIPSFCGEGMYGIHVHEAAIAYGVKLTGCTVHLVNEETDGGAILLQKAIPVKTKNPGELQQAVLSLEHEALVEAVQAFARGQVRIHGRQVEITSEKGDIFR